MVAKFGLDNEILERSYPTPPDWTWISRWKLRTARGQEHPEESTSGLVDWASTGNLYRQVVARLEDPTIDGEGVKPQLGDGEDIYVEGIGKTGLDVSNQSEPWRRGYHEALMGAARAAEHLDTWVRDKSRNIAFPPDVIIGPSNPRPKPVPYGAKSPPKEEDCEPAFEAPHVFYMKILTTHGFTSRQRLDAALSYADWLQYKGLNDSAENMYSWATDIAVAGMPSTSNPIDKSTGIISKEATGVTSNLLVAASSLAAHHAQLGNLAAALPIFLSILRAQQTLPLATPTSAERTSINQSSMGWILSLLAPPEYPPPPPTGDEPLTRTPFSVCAEAGTMAHIGEILFASSISDPLPKERAPSKDPTPAQFARLSWTRDAVDLAESTLRSISNAPAPPPLLMDPNPKASPRSQGGPDEKEAKKRCRECLNVGMANWTKMVGRFEQAERLAKVEAARKKNKPDGKQESEEKTRWFWQKSEQNRQMERTNTNQEGRWEMEASRVAERARAVRRLLREEGLGD